MGVLFFVFEENVLECIGVRVFIIDIILNLFLLKKIKGKLFINFRVFVFISNKLLWKYG